VQVIEGEWTQREDTAKSVTEEINPALLPDWIKVKMAMLDLMSEYEKLPCGSFKTVSVYSTPTAWFIYEDVSSTRERSVKGEAEEQSEA